MSKKPHQSKLFLCYSMLIAVMLAFFVNLDYSSRIETTRDLASVLFCKDLFLENKQVSHSLTFERVPDRYLLPRELRKLATQVASNHESEIIRGLQKTKPNAEGRVFYKLYENKNFTAWVIEWQNNGTGIHDHVHSQVGIHVMRGQVVEEFFTPPKTNPLIRIFKEGQSASMAGTPYVHRFSGSKAISVHIYSPPLKEMTNYEIENNQLKTVGRWVEDAL